MHLVVRRDDKLNFKVLHLRTMMESLFRYGSQRFYGRFKWSQARAAKLSANGCLFRSEEERASLGIPFSCVWTERITSFLLLSPSVSPPYRTQAHMGLKVVTRSII